MPQSCGFFYFNVPHLSAGQQEKERGYRTLRLRKLNNRLSGRLNGRLSSWTDDFLPTFGTIRAYCFSSTFCAVHFSPPGHPLPSAIKRFVHHFGFIPPRRSPAVYRQPMPKAHSVPVPAPQFSAVPYCMPTPCRHTAFWSAE